MTVTGIHRIWMVIGGIAAIAGVRCDAAPLTAGDVSSSSQTEATTERRPDSDPAPRSGPPDGPDRDAASSSSPDLDEDNASRLHDVSSGSDVTSPPFDTLSETSILQPVDFHTVGRFGAGSTGFIQWMGRRGRHLVWYAFVDTTGDGEVSLAFGHHGRPRLDQPKPRLVDLADDEITNYDSYLTQDGTGRYAALARGGAIELLDVELDRLRNLTEAHDLDPIDERRNPCLPPRELSLSPSGHLAYPDLEQHTGTVVDLDLGTRRRLEVREGRLWRLSMYRQGTVKWLTVREDTNDNGRLDMPRQQTSCACRWCGQFGLSSGYYGWEGDRFHRQIVTFAEDGSQQRMTIDQKVIPLNRHLLVAADRKLYRPDGTSLELPDDCDRAKAVPMPSHGGKEDVSASRRAVLECGEHEAIWHIEDNELIELDSDLGMIQGIEPAMGDEGRRWIPALRERESSSRSSPAQLLRVDIETGRPTRRALPVDEVEITDRGWVVAWRQATLKLVRLADGHVWQRELDAPIERIRGATVHTDADTDYLLIFGDNPGYHRLDSDPSGISWHGCLVSAARRGRRGVEIGPWTVRCPLRHEPMLEAWSSSANGADAP